MHRSSALYSRQYIKNQNIFQIKSWLEIAANIKMYSHTKWLWRLKKQNVCTFVTSWCLDSSVPHSLHEIHTASCLRCGWRDPQGRTLQEEAWMLPRWPTYPERERSQISQFCQDALEFPTPLLPHPNLSPCSGLWLLESSLAHSLRDSPNFHRTQEELNMGAFLSFCLQTRTSSHYLMGSVLYHGSSRPSGSNAGWSGVELMPSW